jgi:hypothetical protein
MAKSSATNRDRTVRRGRRNRVNGVQLLADLRELFYQHDPPREVLFTAEILDGLNADETRPWSEWKNGRPMTARQLSHQLKPFNIGPQTVGRGTETDKGYKLKWFEDAFVRYLPPRSVTASQPSNSAGFEPSPSVTPAVDVTDENAEHASISAGCDGVADREPVLDEEEVWTG